MQNELPLETDLINLMITKPKPIGWRRAHRRTTKRGKSIPVAIAIVNGDGGEKEQMIRRQLPQAFKEPISTRQQGQIALSL